MPEEKTDETSPAKKATPIAKGKTVLARVTLLDGSLVDINLDRKSKGEDLLEKVCDHINLLERDYFGLTYEDRHDPRNWLELDKRIGKFVKIVQIFLQLVSVNATCCQSTYGQPIESTTLISFLRQSSIGWTTAGNPVSSLVNYLPKRLLRTRDDRLNNSNCSNQIVQYAEELYAMMFRSP
ncbi:hypothetical protein J6590_079166 [Homalodisca vitripennis]|nr:hypothetical protein J6590_079166 [Homalodisca vitripennis]